MVMENKAPTSQTEKGASNMDLVNRYDEEMARGAMEYMRSKGIDYRAIDIDTLVKALTDHRKATFFIALDDANQAIKSNLSAYADQTFLASARLAGINAIKDVIPKSGEAIAAAEGGK
jgi:hypothetical protein